MINMPLVKALSLSYENIDKLNCLHWVRSQIHKSTKLALDENRNDAARYIAGCLSDIEIELQKLWGFPEDLNYYRFWNVVGCSCPKMDNNDRYPHGYYVTNADCILHGKEQERIITVFN
jgi:hypothetical protein